MKLKLNSPEVVQEILLLLLIHMNELKGNLKMAQLFFPILLMVRKKFQIFDSMSKASFTASRCHRRYCQKRASS